MPADCEGELFWHVDENDKPLGSILRKDAHSGSGLIHRATTVFVLNLNHVLLQLRSASKDMAPLHWADSVGEHLGYKESYFKAAKRGLLEELGVSKAKLIKGPKTLYNLGLEREYLQIYFTHLKSQKFALDPAETDSLCWVPLKHFKLFTLHNPCSLGLIQTATTVGWL